MLFEILHNLIHSNSEFSLCFALFFYRLTGFDRGKTQQNSYNKISKQIEDKTSSSCRLCHNSSFQVIFQHAQRLLEFWQSTIFGIAPGHLPQDDWAVVRGQESLRSDDVEPGAVGQRRGRAGGGRWERAAAEPPAWASFRAARVS